jgi:hypothetical protein
MPCDQIQEVTVEFNAATDLDALALALEGLGVRAVRREGRALVFSGGVFRDGEFILNGYEAPSFPKREQIVRAYTKATVLNAADKFAWVAAPKKALAAAVAGFTRRW